MKARLSLIALTAALLFANTGCRARITVVSAPGASAPAAPAAPAAPGSTTAAAPVPPPAGGQGAPAPAPLPGSIGAAGASPSNPPAAALPAPEDSKQRIARLVQTYGIKSIYGSMADAKMLDAVETMLSRYPAGSLHDLDICCEPSEADPKEVKDTQVLAYWTPTGPDTQEFATGGKMFLFREPADFTVMLHEAGHHLTLFADCKFGIELSQSLGWTYAKDNNRYRVAGDDSTKANGDWTATSVPDSAYNRDYARSNNREHMAETIMIHLTTPDEHNPWMDDAAKYKCPDAAKQAMNAKLGAGKSAGGA